ncbi:hypothetical protein F5148DRAFT_1146655 [Russula earlei]|uniref:Uncharacterized protein n=1 Tax=Russula earlei TaxID=71964 RepID=A0ACC0UJE5_9AGAM|nr:hypothetical protein F5148DRAFT_1146655 [Russula earlei]
MLEDQICLGEMAKLQFAQMQIDDEYTDIKMQKRNPTMQVESTDGEDFDFDKVGDMSLSESEVIFQPVHKKKAAEKAAKAATWEDIEKMMEQIRHGDGDMTTMTGRFTCIHAAPSMYANACLQEPGKGKKTVKVPEDVDPFENGGLNEEDADAPHPAFEPQPFVQFAPKDREHIGEHHERDPRHQNNRLLQLVKIIDNGSDVKAPRNKKKETKVSKTSEALKK